MPRRRYIAIAATAFTIAVGAAGCGSGTHHDASSHQAKHTVLTQASLGFGAFHRFIWTPARAGRLADPGSQAVSQATKAARFTSNKLRITAHQVQGSKQLQVLFAPLQLTADKIGALRGTLSRHSSVAQIEMINQILLRIAAAAKNNGAHISDASAAEIAAAGGPRA